MKTNRAKKGSAKQFKAVEGRPLTEEQIAQFLEFYKIHNTIPGNKLPCNVTRKLTTCVGPWKDKKIKEYGGLENLLRNYKRKEASPKKQAVQHKEQSEVVWEVPVFRLKVPVPMTKEQLAQDSKSICLRPDIFLNNGRHCEGCVYAKICLNSRKKFPAYAKAA